MATATALSSQKHDPGRKGALFRKGGYTEPFPVSRHWLVGILEGEDRMTWRRGNYHTDCLLQEGYCDWLETHWLG